MSDRPLDPITPAVPDAELAAWREAYRDLQSAGSANCPDDETLAALALGEDTGEATGETTGAARERLADHVAACRRCAGRYRTLRDLHRAAAAATPSESRSPGDEGRSRRRGRRLRLLAAAAALLGMVGLGWLVGLPRRVPDEDGDLRRGPAAAVEEEGVRPAPEARLAGPPRQLVWPAREGALSYRVILYDAGASPLWRSGPLATTHLALPDAARSRLAAGESYFWVVEVGRGEDAAVSRLGPFWFSVEGETAR